RFRRAPLRVQDLYAPGRGCERGRDRERPARRSRLGGVQLLGGAHDRGPGSVVQALPAVQRVRPGVPRQPAADRRGHDRRGPRPDVRCDAAGLHYVQGCARNELGPRVYVSDSITVTGVDTAYKNIRASPTGGNTVFTANVELRVPAPIFPDRVRLGLFVDVGQVWERGDTGTTVSGLRVTPGLGLRFITPLGPVRLDAA